MSTAKATAGGTDLQRLPSVDKLLRSETGRRIAQLAGADHAASLVRSVVGELRDEMLAGGNGAVQSVEDLRSKAENMLGKQWSVEQVSGIKHVINATGVIIHTNLGRAPLSEAARQAVDAASKYCALEYDLESGKRGRRGKRVEDLIVELTGAEDALIVNNCAAAAFFVLTVLAGGSEVVISRGELVEIGGDFRVPDVLAQSGAVLREVGTTNRTKIADYEKAMGPNTSVVLRVHPSNYRIVGFTSAPAVAELTDLAHAHELLIYEDLGSGALLNMSGFASLGEPVVRESISAGVDVVTFSGDKLLGGPQAGIIAGKSNIIERLRKHSLYRALRVDKLCYAALESTLEAFRRETATIEIPVLRMLSMTSNEIDERVRLFAGEIKKVSGSNLSFEIVGGSSAVGGGAAPEFDLPTRLLAITHRTLSSSEFESALRKSEPPVIARIIDDRVVLDLRTISEDEEKELLQVLKQI
jgi:L-seryl-tRNA(Ser) seleniumtransferase